MQPDLDPALTDFDLTNPKRWACLQHSSTCSDFDFRQYFYTDNQVQLTHERVNQLENARKEELKQLIKDAIRDMRSQQNEITQFNEEIT